MNVPSVPIDRLIALMAKMVQSRQGVQSARDGIGKKDTCQLFKSD
jgi:hypothetical protein